MFTQVELTSHYTDVWVYSSSQIISIYQGALKLNGTSTLSSLGRVSRRKRKLSEMRHAKNLHPEWGYVPAGNRFGRTISIFLVATAIGATAGGGVVLSLVDVPTGQASVGAHSLAAPAQALISAPEVAQPIPQPIAKATMDSGANGRPDAVASESSTNPKIVAPAGIAPLTEVAPNDASVKVATPPSAAAEPAESKATKKRRVATRQRDGLFGFVLGERYSGSYRDGRWAGFYQNGGNRYHAWGYGRN